MPDFGFLLKVSRTRFWIYILGPYFIGIAASAAVRSDFITFKALVFAIYFTLPANLLIYGINDIFDYETDRLNKKKEVYEQLVQPVQHLKLLVAILILNLPFIAALFLIGYNAIPAFAGFLFFSIFYSTPPIRAKTKPFIDSAFNILYVFPGIFAYQLISGEFPPLVTILAATCWTFAMHAYSAIPDISADREANIKTVATQLGANGTLILCLVLYLVSSVLVYKYLQLFSLFFALVYAAMIVISYIKKSDLFNIYKFFPIINAAVGFALFWFIAFEKLI